MPATNPFSGPQEPLDRGTRIRLAGLLALMAVLYFLAYGFFGIGGNEHGVIQALAWRIYNGQSPYLDFILIRPPLSPYLHVATFWLPESMQMVTERLMFYLVMAGSVWFAILSLGLFFDFRKISLSPELFGIMAFVLSVHNYPPMPVDTVDALFFASAGVYYAASARRMRGQVVGVWLMVAAALCRQSFYLMPLVGLALLMERLTWRAWFRTVAVSLAPVVLALCTLMVLQQGWLDAFLLQTINNTRIRDLFDLGVQPYVKPMLWIALPLVIVWRMQVLYSLRYFPATIFWLFFFGILLAQVIRAWTQGAYVPPSFGFSQGFFVLGVAISIKGLWINIRGNMVLLSLLLVAWFSGLTWEYANPMLFFTPILFAMAYGLYEELDFRAPQYLYGILCIILIWMFALLNQYPSDDGYLEKMTFRAEDVFPKLDGIKTGKSTYERLKEFKRLEEKYGPYYSVFPEFPQAHLFLGKMNPLPLDSEMPIIRWSPPLKARMQQALKEKVSYIFLETGQGIDTTYYEFPLSRAIRDQWPMVERGSYFEVRCNPDQP